MSELAIRETEAPAGLAAGYKAAGAAPPRAFMVESEARRYTAFLSRDPIGGNGPPDDRWHLSIAGQDGALPEWRHLAELAHRLRPGVTFALGVPPRSHWMNVHEYTLHLWQLDDANLEAQWLAERQGDPPT